jgi:hypothetical protein
VENEFGDMDGRSHPIRQWLHLVGALAILITVSATVVLAQQARPTERGFARYTDPAGRYSLDYPATMKVEAAKPEEVKIYHPGASLRITIFVERRKNQKVRDADLLLAIFRKRMQEEMKDFSILEEGKLAGLAGSQGYLICSFRDPRGIQLVQVVQYVVSRDRLLQLIVSDRPEGFRNLADVIRKIHRSLHVTDALLK